MGPLLTNSPFSPIQLDRRLIFPEDFTRKLSSLSQKRGIFSGNLIVKEDGHLQSTNILSILWQKIKKIFGGHDGTNRYLLEYKTLQFLLTGRGVVKSREEFELVRIVAEKAGLTPLRLAAQSQNKNQEEVQELIDEISLMLFERTDESKSVEKAEALLAKFSAHYREELFPFSLDGTIAQVFHAVIIQPQNHKEPDVFEAEEGYSGNHEEESFGETDRNPSASFQQDPQQSKKQEGQLPSTSPNAPKQHAGGGDVKQLYMGASFAQEAGAETSKERAEVSKQENNIQPLKEKELSSSLRKTAKTVGLIALGTIAAVGVVCVLSKYFDGWTSGGNIGEYINLDASNLDHSFSWLTQCVVKDQLMIADTSLSQVVEGMGDFDQKVAENFSNIIGKAGNATISHAPQMIGDFTSQWMQEILKSGEDVVKEVVPMVSTSGTEDSTLYKVMQTADTVRKLALVILCGGWAIHRIFQAPLKTHSDSQDWESVDMDEKENVDVREDYVNKGEEQFHFEVRTEASIGNEEIALLNPEELQQAKRGREDSRIVEELASFVEECGGNVSDVELIKNLLIKELGKGLDVIENFKQYLNNLNALAKESVLYPEKELNQLPHYLITDSWKLKFSTRFNSSVGEDFFDFIDKRAFPFMQSKASSNAPLKTFVVTSLLSSENAKTCRDIYESLDVFKTFLFNRERKSFELFQFDEFSQQLENFKSIHDFYELFKNNRVDEQDTGNKLSKKNGYDVFKMQFKEFTIQDIWYEIDYLRIKYTELKKGLSDFSDQDEGLLNGLINLLIALEKDPSIIDLSGVRMPLNTHSLEMKHPSLTEEFRAILRKNGSQKGWLIDISELLGYKHSEFHEEFFHKKIEEHRELIDYLSKLPKKAKKYDQKINLEKKLEFFKERFNQAETIYSTQLIDLAKADPNAYLPLILSMAASAVNFKNRMAAINFLVSYPLSKLGEVYKTFWFVPERIHFEINKVLLNSEEFLSKDSDEPLRGLQEIRNLLFKNEDQVALDRWEERFNLKEISERIRKWMEEVKGAEQPISDLFVMELEKTIELLKTTAAYQKSQNAVALNCIEAFEGLFKEVSKSPDYSNILEEFVTYVKECGGDEVDQALVKGILEEGIVTKNFKLISNLMHHINCLKELVKEMSLYPKRDHVCQPHYAKGNQLSRWFSLVLTPGVEQKFGEFANRMYELILQRANSGTPVRTLMVPSLFPRQKTELDECLEFEKILKRTHKSEDDRFIDICKLLGYKLKNFREFIRTDEGFIDYLFQLFGRVTVNDESVNFEDECKFIKEYFSNAEAAYLGKSIEEVPIEEVSNGDSNIKKLRQLADHAVNFKNRISAIKFLKSLKKPDGKAAVSIRLEMRRVLSHGDTSLLHVDDEPLHELQRIRHLLFTQGAEVILHQSTHSDLALVAPRIRELKKMMNELQDPLSDRFVRELQETIEILKIVADFQKTPNQIFLECMKGLDSLATEAILEKAKDPLSGICQLLGFKSGPFRKKIQQDQELIDRLSRWFEKRKGEDQTGKELEFFKEYFDLAETAYVAELINPKNQTFDTGVICLMAYEAVNFKNRLALIRFLAGRFCDRKFAIDRMKVEIDKVLLNIDAFLSNYSDASLSELQEIRKLLFKEEDNIEFLKGKERSDLEEISNRIKQLKEGIHNSEEPVSDLFVIELEKTFELFKVVALLEHPAQPSLNLKFVHCISAFDRLVGEARCSRIAEEFENFVKDCGGDESDVGLMRKILKNQFEKKNFYIINDLQDYLNYLNNWAKCKSFGSDEEDQVNEQFKELPKKSQGIKDYFMTIFDQDLQKEFEDFHNKMLFIMQDRAKANHPIKDLPLASAFLPENTFLVEKIYEGLNEVEILLFKGEKGNEALLKSHLNRIWENYELIYKKMQIFVQEKKDPRFNTNQSQENFQDYHSFLDLNFYNSIGLKVEFFQMLKSKFDFSEEVSKKLSSLCDALGY